MSAFDSKGVQLQAELSSQTLVLVDLSARRERSPWHEVWDLWRGRSPDSIEEWFLSGAVGGFNVVPDAIASGLETFVDFVVPELRRRGIFRTEYTGRTLREHYGLERPESRYAREKLQAVPV